MRLWTFHPRFLDVKGLLALWREALLAQKVLQGATRGYKSHPQLVRFKETRAPVRAIGFYLSHVYRESVRRGYRFDASKIADGGRRVTIRETEGQLLHEWRHFLQKLRRRAPALCTDLEDVQRPQAHPIFRIVPGAARPWEKSPQAGGKAGLHLRHGRGCGSLGVLPGK